jgi:selT/selW/selH-like putative selenoprotein
LAQALKKEFPDLEIIGNEDGNFRIGSFEVTLDGKLLYSKLEKHAFPEDADIVKMVGERV